MKPYYDHDGVTIYHVGWWNHLLCEILEWHSPSAPFEVCGATLASRCCRCRRPVLLGSQGNWFSVGEPRITQPNDGRMVR